MKLHNKLYTNKVLILEAKKKKDFKASLLLVLHISPTTERARVVCAILHQMQLSL